MSSVVRNYVWWLNDVNLCLTFGNFFTKSPTFAIVDSQCEFYLQFGYNEGEDQVSVFLCRRDDDRGAPEVTVNFLLSLQSGKDGHVDTYRSTCNFTKGQTDGFTISKSKQDPFPPVGEHDSFVVKCKTFNPSPTFEHTSADIDKLSEDLLRLHVTGGFANAQLVAGECSIPVHKEILSVRSPVFKRMFETSACSTMETPFPAPVVRAILAFVYSANITRVLFRDSSLEQVLLCAKYYGVSELVDMLTPSITYFTTKVERYFEMHLLRFDIFTKLNKSLTRAEHHPVRMKFNKNIEMVATLFLDSYVKSETIDVQISLNNMLSIKSVRARVYLLDDYNIPCQLMKAEKTLKPDDGGTASWRFECQPVAPRKNLISPGYPLSLQCEVKFRVSDEFSVSDPDFFEGGRYEARCIEASRTFVRSLECLMESVSLSDTQLLLPSVDKTGSIRVPAHRSILAARSPFFRSVLEAGEDITLDVPKVVASALLRYVYTGNLVAFRSEAVCLLHGAAATCGMDNLRIACREVAANMALDLKNVYSVYLIAVREGDQRTQESCKAFILENKDIVFGSVRWENFRKRHGDASADIKRYVTEKKWISVI